MYDHKNQSQELVALLESIMDFKRWGFKQTYIHVSHGIFPEIIYNSEWCRVKFSFEQTDYYHAPPHLQVRYARFHAPNDNFFMTVNGENYWCWHMAYNVLRFLDGMTPKEAANELDTYQYYWPPVIKKFTNTEFAKKLRRPEWEMRIETVIWEHYGQKLFEVFDLRQPELWASYVQFTRELYKLTDAESYFGMPPKDKIY